MRLAPFQKMLSEQFLVNRTVELSVLEGCRDGGNVTNHHVVQGMSQAFVLFSDGKVQPVLEVAFDYCRAPRQSSNHSMRSTCVVP